MFSTGYDRLKLCLRVDPRDELYPPRARMHRVFLAILLPCAALAEAPQALKSAPVIYTL
jgi:hypothetical protein